MSITPIDPMRGDNIYIELDTSGGADTARITISPIMQATESRSEVATHLNGSKTYQMANGEYIYDLNGAINNKIDTLEFVTDVEFKVNIINGVLIRTPYTITVEIEKGTMIRTATFTLSFEGDVRQTLKME